MQRIKSQENRDRDVNGFGETDFIQNSKMTRAAFSSRFIVNLNLG